VNGTVVVTPTASIPIQVNHYDFSRTDNLSLVVATRATPPVDVVNVTHQGDVFATFTSAAGAAVHGTFNRKVSKSTSGTFIGKDLKTHNIATTRNWTLAYIPNSAWHRELRPVAGTVTFSGTYTGTIDGRTVDGTVSTPTPLTIDPVCRTWIVAGEIDRVSADLSVKIVWSGCGSYTVTHTP
jgi:hypothetical protein